MQMLELKKITPALYEVRAKDSWYRVGRIDMQEDGLYQFFSGTGTTGEGFLSSHTLREIANILDAMNAPLEEKLESYFASLPAKISREEEIDDTPF